MRNYFILNGVDSRDFGVYISGQGTFSAPRREYNMIPIPGRNGDLVGNEKRFENLELTYHAFIYANFKENIRNFRNFLLSQVGYQKLTDSYHQDEFRMAVYEGPFEPDVTPKNDAGEFEIVFNCKPQRYLNSGEEVISFDGETNTYSGEIATFEGKQGDTISKITATIDPVQDLNGYDAPWPPGGGKNILKLENKTVTINGVTAVVDSNGFVTINGTATGNAYLVIGTISTPPETLVFSSSQDDRKAYLYASGETTVYPNDSFTGGVDRTLYIFITSGETANNKQYKLQLEKGSTPTSWTPYSNICPISGHDGMNVQRTGKNLLPKAESKTHQGIQYTANEDGSVSVSGTSTGNSLLDIGRGSTTLKAGTYVASISGSNATVTLFKIVDGAASVLKNGVGTFTLTEETSVFLRLSFTSGTTASGTAYPQIELGSTASAYEPFSGTSLPISWQSEAGTVYGGNLTINEDGSCVLTVDRAMVDLGTLNYSAGFQGYYTTGLKDLIAIPASVEGSGLLSSQFVVGNTTGSNQMYIQRSANYLGWVVFLPSAAYESPAAFKTAMSGVQLVYELATPITYTLPSVTMLETLLGTNNIWTDVGNTAVDVFSSAIEIENPTRFVSQPLLRVYGSGQLGINSDTITISRADVYTDIDCAMMDCFKGATNKNQFVSFSSYNFPVLQAGENNLSLGSGITKVEITPRWWQL